MRKNVKNPTGPFCTLAALWMAMYSRTALAQDMNAAEDFGVRQRLCQNKRNWAVGGRILGWRYTADGGYYVSQWKFIDNEWYYLKQDGHRHRLVAAGRSFGII